MFRWLSLWLILEFVCTWVCTRNLSPQMTRFWYVVTGLRFHITVFSNLGLLSPLRLQYNIKIIDFFIIYIKMQVISDGG